MAPAGGFRRRRLARLQRLDEIEMLAERRSALADVGAVAAMAEDHGDDLMKIGDEAIARGGGDQPVQAVVEQLAARTGAKLRA